MILALYLTTTEYLEIVSLIFTFVGGIFFYVQWQRSVKIKRAEFIHQILDKLRFDKDLLKAVYTLDYNNYWYNDNFHQSELEHLIDKLFCYIDYVCYLKVTGNISSIEFQIFKYDVHRICNSKPAQAYLWNLYHFSVKNKTNCSYQNIINYGVEANLLPNNFFTDQKLYQKYLNW